MVLKTYLFGIIDRWSAYRPYINCSLGEFAPLLKQTENTRNMSG